MARFMGTVKGGRGEASRLGGTSSGIMATAQGWNVGVRVCGGADDENGEDVFMVYATGGSNARTSSKAVAAIYLDDKGQLVVESQDAYYAKKAEQAKAREAAKALEAKPKLTTAQMTPAQRCAQRIMKEERAKVRAAAKAQKPESFEVNPGRVNRGGSY